MRRVGLSGVRWWLVVGAACAAAAQPAIPSAADPGELAAAERAAADKALPTKEREAAADRAIEVRRALIASAAADDARLAGWLIDQSGALLARLGRDGSDSAALFGIALPAQREAVKRAAAEAAGLLERAARCAAETAKALSAQGVLPEDPRMTAVEQDRTVRIPFFRGRAEALLAGVSSGKERVAHAEAAVGAVGKLALANAGPESIRRVNVAAAMMLKRTARDAGDAQTVLDECAAVVKTAREKPGVVPPATVAEAWLGMVEAGVALGRIEPSLKAVEVAVAQPPFTEDGRGDALLCVLAADGATRALFDRAVVTDDPALLLRAVAQQEALLARPDLGVRTETLRPLVFEKLAVLAAGAPESLKLPPALRLARAIAAARDPAQRGAALAAFEGVAGDKDAGVYAADALWEEAVLLTQPPPGTPENRLKAAAALTRLAREFPAHARAQEAVVAALAYARALAVESPDAAMKREGRAAYGSALDVATASYTTLANIDLWRYERARLLAQPAEGAAGEEDLARAIVLLEEVAAGSPVGADAGALCERAYGELLDGLFAKVRQMRRAGDEAGVAGLAKGTIVARATRAVAWARSHGSAQADRFRLDLADATVESGRGARAAYEELLPRAAGLPGGLARVKLGLARSQVLSGDAAAGFTTLREVAASLDAPAEGAARPEMFWQAWTLMLEMLRDQNADGSRTGAIRAQVKRLRAIDAGLGGEPWRGRIEGVEGKE